MKQPTSRKFLEYIGRALGFIGILLIMGSVVVWQVGPEMLRNLYESIRPVVPFFLVGVGLLVLGILLSPGLRQTNAAAPGTKPPESVAPAGAVRCAKCAADNDGLAKFCDQCGASL
jgi:hypothetical protein